MIRPWTIGLAGGIGVLVAVMAFADRDTRHADHDQDHTRSIPATVVEPASARARPSPSPTDRDEAIQRYRSADRHERRALLERWAADPDPAQAQHRVLSAVGGDPSPAGADPLAEHAARLLAARLDDPVALQLARTAMLTERDQKRRWILVSSLLEHGANLADDPGRAGGHLSLAADLVEVYFDDPGDPVRTRIREGITAVAGEEIAVVLAAGPTVDPQALASVMQQREATEHALARAHPSPVSP